MTEVLPNLETPNSLRGNIEATANHRADYTREYLENNGKNLVTLQDQLRQSPFQIEFKADDNKSLALAIFDLQTKLGFPQTDSTEGCDGKLGPITYHALQRALLKKSTGNQLATLSDTVEAAKPSSDSAKPAPSAPIPNPESPVPIAPTPQTEIARETPRLPEVSLRETVFVGDSITVGAKSHNPGAEFVAKGAMQTGWMKNNFDKFLAEKAQGMHQDSKRAVILGGFNDITSNKSLKSIQDNLSHMYKAAKKAGLSVVACTIPGWDIDAFLTYIRKDWAKRNWGEYPLSKEELKSRTEKLNQWILDQKDVDQGVDLYTEMADKNKYKRNDFVHPSSKGSAAMSAYIRGVGNIKSNA